LRLKKLRDGVLLSQERYVNDILIRPGMNRCKEIDTPLSSSEKISAYDGHPLGIEDITWYQSLVGSLQYLTLTRPDIAFVVNKVCQFLHAPTTTHWSLVKKDITIREGYSEDGIKHWSV
jgi:histone deacetylase 1/2